MLLNTSCGFGAMALAGMCQNEVLAAKPTGAVLAQPHFKPLAKRIVFIFMQGGPSHVDTFDYNPRLAKDDGKSFGFADDRTRAKTGVKTSSHKVMKSPWAFKRYGETGRWVSDLFPHVAQEVDQLCMVHSLHTEGVAHGPATLFLHCGATNFIRPSMGSWVTYGLGTENENLPGFVVFSPSPT